MAGPRGPTLAEVRAMLRLSHALHTSSDSVARKKQLLSGLCQLLAAESGIDVVSHMERACRRQAVVSITRHGAARVGDELLPLRYAAFINGAAPTFRPTGIGQQWHHVNWPCKSSRSPRLSHCLWCPAPMSDDLIIACLSITRAGNPRQPFVARERVILHLVHTEMSWVYQPDFLLASHGAASLSPRQRQTLQYLLCGHSEKQIAAKLRLSPNTVHHHVKALHRHFGVSSRSELLARWLT